MTFPPVATLQMPAGCLTILGPTMAALAAMCQSACSHSCPCSCVRGRELQGSCHCMPRHRATCHSAQPTCANRNALTLRVCLLQRCLRQCAEGAKRRQQQAAFCTHAKASLCMPVQAVASQQCMHASHHAQAHKHATLPSFEAHSRTPLRHFASMPLSLKLQHGGVSG
jgi:hypothetical protein